MQGNPRRPIRTFRSVAILAACAAALLVSAAGPPPEPQPIRVPTPTPIDTPVPSVELPPAPVEIPMPLVEGQPVVEARVHGKGPYKFLVDTGSSTQAVISEGLARKLGLHKVGVQLLGDSAGENLKPGHLYELDELSLGPATMRGLWVTVLASKRKPPWERNGLDGVIGFELFGTTLVTLDYPARKLRLERGELPADAPAVFPFTMPAGVPRIPVKLGALEVDAILDSGSMSGFVVAADVAQKIAWTTQLSVVGKIKTAFNEAEIYSGRSKEPLKINAVELPLPVVEITPLLQGHNANLGSRLLRNFRITFDTPHARVRFEGPVDLRKGGAAVATGD